MVSDTWKILSYRLPTHVHGSVCSYIEKYFLKVLIHMLYERYCQVAQERSTTTFRTL